MPDFILGDASVNFQNAQQKFQIQVFSYVLDGPYQNRSLVTDDFAKPYLGLNISYSHQINTRLNAISIALKLDVCL